MALTANKPLKEVIGKIGAIPASAAKIYEGAMVGLNAGYGRGLVAGDVFCGHAVNQCDNSAGSAGDLQIDVKAGKYQLQVTLTGVGIKDVGRPVYASADDTLSFSAVGNSFAGKVDRYVAANTAIVEFEPFGVDEFGPNNKRETKSVNYTLDAEDSGKIIYVDTDGVVISVPATATALNCIIVNAGADGAVGLSLSPVAADKIMGPDIAGADNKDLINTKATAKRGDFVAIINGHADGPVVTNMRGTWATEG